MRKAIIRDGVMLLQVLEHLVNRCTLQNAEKQSFIFVSRQDPVVDDKELLMFLQDHKNLSYSVEILNTKHDGYKSFKVGVPGSVWDDVFSPSFRPMGLL